MTFKSLSNATREENLTEVDATLRSAETLLRSRFCKESLRAELNKLCWEMAGLRVITMTDPLIIPDKMPKATRLHLCTDIITAWKFIRGADKMPGRINDAYSPGHTPTGRFHEFLTKLLPDINQDELHRNILAVDNELNRLSAEEEEVLASRERLAQAARAIGKVTPLKRSRRA